MGFGWSLSATLVLAGLAIILRMDAVTNWIVLMRDPGSAFQRVQRLLPAFISISDSGIHWGLENINDRGGDIDNIEGTMGDLHEECYGAGGQVHDSRNPSEATSNEDLSM